MHFCLELLLNCLFPFVQLICQWFLSQSFSCCIDDMLLCCPVCPSFAITCFATNTQGNQTQEHLLPGVIVYAVIGLGIRRRLSSRWHLNLSQIWAAYSLGGKLVSELCSLSLLG